MTKKHFVALAKAFASVKPDPYLGAGIWSQWKRDVSVVSSACAEQNTRFDRTRFLKACEGK